MTESMRLLSLVAILITGCATTRLVRVVPEPGDGQKKLRGKGTPIVWSEGTESDVAISPKGGATGRYDVVDRKIPFLVFVRNRSDSQIAVSERDFSAGANSWAGASFADVLRASDLEAEMGSDPASEEAANAFATAVLAHAGEQANVGRVSQLLRATTLDPGDSVAGGIVIERPHLAGCEPGGSVPLLCHLWIAVEVAGDMHRFRFVETE